MYALNEHKLMHYLSSFHTVTIPLNVSGLLFANVYRQQMVRVAYIHRYLPDDGQLACPKDLEVE
jgi:hypothetical protein